MSRLQGWSGTLPSTWCPCHLLLAAARAQSTPAARRAARARVRLACRCARYDAPLSVRPGGGRRRDRRFSA